MQPAHQAAGSALSNRSSMPLPNESAASTKPRIAASLLDDLWTRMAAMYGHTWVSQYTAEPHGVAGDTWAAVLAGLTGAQIAAGMRSCAASGEAWPPSAPRFRAWCLSVPEFPTVRAELMARNGTRTPFARLVWQHVDGFRFRTVAAEQGDRMLREAYDAARDHVMRGGALPEPAAGEIEHVTEPRKPCDDGVARDALAKAAASLGMADEE